MKKNGQYMKSLGQRPSLPAVLLALKFWMTDISCSIGALQLPIRRANQLCPGQTMAQHS